MKTMERLYERLKPSERFRIAVAAFGRGDLAEVDRLNDSTAYRVVKVQEPAYFDRLQRLTWLTLYFMVDVRNLQLAVLAMFSAMSIHLLQSDSRRDRGEPRDDDDARFDELVELIEQKISRLKALHAAWVEFCSGLGVSAKDVDTMIGMPFMGRLEQLKPVQEIIGTIPPDEEYQRECLDHMRSFWKTKLEDRYAALG
jgi:hypothetical protein